MSKHTRPRTVYIKKLDDPLQIEHYELTGPNYSRIKMYKPERYWTAYKNLKSKFLSLNDDMRRALVEEKFVPPWLYEEYEKAKTDFLTAQEIINRDYEKAV